MFLLQRLLELCRDERQEARDGAIQILWRSIELYGPSLDTPLWEECLSRVIFPLLHDLDQRLTEWRGTGAKQEAPLQAKQWDDSKILSLSSVGTVFAEEMVSSMSKLSDFEATVQKLIDYMRTTYLRDRPAVATAAIRALGRIVSVQWSEEKADKGRYLVERAYLAWTEIGELVAGQEIFSLTQGNLEAYSKVYVTLQQSNLLRVDEDRTRQLFGILKGIITYPFSSDYRPDIDVLSPVQASAFDIFAQVDLSSAAIAACALEDLAEYATLAFTKLSDAVRSPSLAETHSKQNQKITYVALFKASTTKLVEVYYRFKSEPLIYESAVERMLAVCLHATSSDCMSLL